MFAEDLTQFFETDDFAVEAEIQQPDSTVVRSVNVILETPSKEERFFSSGSITNSTPKATAQTSDLDGVKRGYLLVIAGTTYELTEPPEDDGTGLSTMNLRKR
jgi:hypothetical protein